MSSHNNYTLVLSEDAQTDIDDILYYTLQTWDVQQQIKYADLLDKALQVIQSDPRKGRPHPKLSSEFFYYHVGRHFIIYRIRTLEVQVVRVLHDQMDISRHV